MRGWRLENEVYEFDGPKGGKLLDLFEAAGQLIV